MKAAVEYKKKFDPSPLYEEKVFDLPESAFNFSIPIIKRKELVENIISFTLGMSVSVKDYKRI